MGLDSGEQIVAEKIFPGAYKGGPLYDVRRVSSLTVVGGCHALLGTLLGLQPSFPVRYGGQAQEREEGGDQNARGGAIALVGALILIIIMLIAFVFFLIVCGSLRRRGSEKRGWWFPSWSPSWSLGKSRLNPR